MSIFRDWFPEANWEKKTSNYAIMMTANIIARSTSQQQLQLWTYNQTRLTREQHALANSISQDYIKKQSICPKGIFQKTKIILKKHALARNATHLPVITTSLDTPYPQPNLQLNRQSAFVIGKIFAIPAWAKDTFEDIYCKPATISF